MNTIKTSFPHRWKAALPAAAVLLLTLGTGCGHDTSLTIKVDKYINTAMHHDNSPDLQTGEPLDVDVVMVTPDDLKRDALRSLRPGSGITCRDWFENREALRKELLPAQIKSRTQEEGGGLIGFESRKDKNDTYEFKSLNPQKTRNVIIYVFGRFARDPDQGVLKVPPAIFEKPGEQIIARIGVNKSEYGSSPTYGQFIKKVE